MQRTVNVVIANWNSGALLRRCLQSISDSRPQSLARVIVVDNASSDGSERVTDLAKFLPLQIISNGENKGFAAACNQGAAECASGDFLFMNPDVVVRNETIDRAACYPTFLNGQAGILGVRLLDSDGRTQPSTSHFPTPARILAQSCGLHFLRPSLGPFDAAWDHASTRDVDQIMGAFCLVRRALFEKLGGFDERFFVYYEDVDFCVRAARVGARRLHVADAAATHTGQGTTDSIKDIRLFYLLRSRMLYAAKHFGRPGRIVVALATLAIEPVARGALLLVRGDFGGLGQLARGYGMLYAALPQLRDANRRATPASDGR